MPLALVLNHRGLERQLLRVDDDVLVLAQVTNHEVVGLGIGVEVLLGPSTVGLQHEDSPWWLKPLRHTFRRCGNPLLVDLVLQQNFRREC